MPAVRSVLFRYCLLAAPLLGLWHGTAAQAASAPSSCHYAQWPALPIEQLKNGALVVDGTINQQPVRMLLDTGASQTELIRASADRIGLSLTRIPLHMRGVGGRADVFSAKVDDIGIGEFHTQNKRLAVLDALGHSGAAALIGADFLFQNDLEVDLADQQIRFFHADGCGDTFLAYWDPHASQIALDQRTASSRWPLIEVQLNGVTLTAMIDTGANISLIDLDAASRAGITRQSPGTRPVGAVGGVGSGRLPVWDATFNTFTIGDETINRAEIGVADLHGERREHGFPDMIIGRDFLRAHRLLFALSQNRLYFSYLGGPVFSDALAAQRASMGRQ